MDLLKDEKFLTLIIILFALPILGILCIHFGPNEDNDLRNIRIIVQDSENEDNNEEVDIISESTTVPATINNTEEKTFTCDKDKKAKASKYSNYLYVSGMINGCAVNKDDEETIKQKEAYARQIATRTKDSWMSEYMSTITKGGTKVSFLYGSEPIKNKNGNIIGWAVVISIDNEETVTHYVLNPKNDKWIKIQ